MCVCVCVCVCVCIYVLSLPPVSIVVPERAVLRGKSVRSWSLDRSFMVDPLNNFSFQPVPNDWCNKGRGMCYPVCGMVHIKDPFLLIKKSRGFPLSLSEWSVTICPTHITVLSTLLNKTFPSFHCCAWKLTEMHFAFHI